MVQLCGVCGVYEEGYVCVGLGQVVIEVIVGIVGVEDQDVYCMFIVFWGNQNCDCVGDCR